MNTPDCKQKVFAFWLYRNADKDGGELTLYGTDPAHYTDDIVYTPVTKKAQWQFKVDEVIANRLAITPTFEAIADTSASMMLAPEADIKLVYGAIGVGATPLEADQLISIVRLLIPNCPM